MAIRGPRYKPSQRLQVLATDTVGFIRKLPTQLIAAFRATLEEITESQLLVHVVDVSHPNAAAQSEAVMQVTHPSQFEEKTTLPWQVDGFSYIPHIRAVLWP